MYLLFFTYLRQKLIAALGCTLNATYFLLTDNSFAIDEHKNMDTSKGSEEATSSITVSIRSLEINKMYPIVHAKRINTKFGSIVFLSIRESEAKIVQNFLPKRYGDVVSDGDMDRINSKRVSFILFIRAFTIPQNHSYSQMCPKAFLIHTYIHTYSFFYSYYHLT